MAKMKVDNLHCGACFEVFDSVEELLEHIDECPSAAGLLPLLYTCWFGKDTVGHPISHFVMNYKRAAETKLIKRYAYSIADESPVLERSKLHQELCKVLDFDYNSFRPFESEKIKKVPSRKESERYLVESIFMRRLQES